MLALRYVRQEALNFLKRRSIKKLRFPEIHRALRERGVCVVPDFLSARDCSGLREEIDRMLIRFEGRIWKDPMESDLRLFGVDLASELFAAYFKDEFIRGVVAEYENCSTIKGFSMAARMSFKEGNQGSGNGWHRDSAHSSQTKSILYLSDTTAENGPFQYLIGSHTPSAFVRGLMKGLYRLDQFRFSEDEIARYREQFPEQALETLVGGEGTLIFADTRGLHRGAPMQGNTRYAVTNYFFTRVEPAPHLLEHLIIRKPA
jgi:hypothetical protein